MLGPSVDWVVGEWVGGVGVVGGFAGKVVCVVVGEGAGKVVCVVVGKGVGCVCVVDGEVVCRVVCWSIVE